MGSYSNPQTNKLSILTAKKLCKEEEAASQSQNAEKMQFRFLSIFSLLVTSTIGRPRIEPGSSNSISNSMSNSNSVEADMSSTKRPLSACEEAIYSCCSSQWSTFPAKRKMLRTQQLP